jgi:hypothetical protein
MGSMMPQAAGQFMGIGGGQASQPMRQQAPQIQQSQGAPQQSPMQGMMQMLMNQMMGIKSSSPRPQPRPQAASPRDALIQTLMGGSYGR